MKISEKKSWEIKWEKGAYKALKNMPADLKKRIFSKVDELKEDPYKGGELKYNLSSLRRIYIGDYRIIYSLRENELVILIIKAGHRKEIYE
jgi:mRNA interferase RelE/StbE